MYFFNRKWFIIVYSYLDFIYIGLMKYISKILFILFICCLVVFFLLSPLLFYSFPYLSTEYIGQFYSLFTPKELDHLQDVERIFVVISLIEVIALFAFLIIFSFFIRLKASKKIVLWLLRWSLISLFLLLLIIAAIFVDFESLFLSFHYVFFPQGNRSFDWSSTLIQLFPIEFFEAITMKIFLTSIISTLIVFVGSWLYLKRKK